MVGTRYLGCVTQKQLSRRRECRHHETWGFCVVTRRMCTMLCTGRFVRPSFMLTIGCVPRRMIARYEFKMFEIRRETVLRIHSN